MARKPVHHTHKWWVNHYTDKIAAEYDKPHPDRKKIARYAEAAAKHLKAIR